MMNLEKIEGFLKEHFGNYPYCVWLGEIDSLELCLCHGRISKISPPLSYNVNQYKNYNFIQHNNHTFILFLLEENYQAIICIQDTSISVNKIVLDQLYLMFSCHYYKEMNKNNNKELDKMIESSQIISSTLDINDLFEKIIQIALTVIPVGNAGVFRLVDKKTNVLTPIATVGLKEDYYDYKTIVGKNISGRVFSEKKPMIFQSKEEILLAHKDDSDEHLNYLKNSVIAEAMIVVPVLFEEECIGTIGILQFSKNGKFSDKHLKLLQGFASQVAVAYNNAKLYKEVQNKLKTVIELSNELEEKNQLLQKGINVHETLTHLSLKNMGISKIIDETNRMMNLPVGYADFIENRIYQSRHSHIPLDLDLIYVLISEHNNSVFYQEINNLTYYFYPVILGSVLFSCIIIKCSLPLSQMDIVTIEQSSSVISLEIAKKMSLTELQYKKTHEYFNLILDKPDDEIVSLKGSQFNFMLSSYSFVALCEIPGSSEPYKSEARIQKLILKINQVFSDINKLVFCFLNKVTILFSFEDLTYINNIIYHLELIIYDWERSEKERIFGGIGSPTNNIKEIKGSYNEANKAILFLKNKSHSGIISYEKIGINRFFINQSNNEIKKFIEEIFSKLYSENHDLEKTLMLYILSNKSAVAVAKELNIHINTFYQRLKRIEERLEISFDNQEDVLKIHLACHLKDTFI